MFIENLTKGQTFCITSTSVIINKTGDISENDILTFGGYNKFAKGYSFFTSDFKIQGNIAKGSTIKIA